MERRVRVHLLDPAVPVEILFLEEHPARELQDLLHGIVEILLLAGERAHLGQRRHAHVEIVEPERFRQRAAAGERAVAEALLLRVNP